MLLDDIFNLSDNLASICKWFELTFNGLLYKFLI